jgi:hypothetical protein
MPLAMAGIVAQPFTAMPTPDIYEYDFGLAGRGTLAFHPFFAVTAGLTAWEMMIYTKTALAGVAGAALAVAGDLPAPPTAFIVPSAVFGTFAAPRAWSSVAANIGTAVDISTCVFAGLCAGKLGLNITANAMNAGIIRVLLAVMKLTPDTVFAIDPFMAKV